VRRAFTAIVVMILVLGGCVSFSAMSVQRNFQVIAEKTLPVVVQVNTVEVFSQEVPNVDGWDFFFPDPGGEGKSQQREFRTQGLGSGVIVERNGDTYYVVTNNHVVGEATEVSITLHDGKTYPAECIGKDPRRDLAVVSFSAPALELAIVRLGDSDALRIGDLVVAVGNPFGYSGTVTSGLVSGLHRSGPTDLSDFIQTDAAINQGNSGGALVDLKGRLVGINSWITTPTGGSIGLGFAIPVNSVKGVVRQLIDTGSLAYGWLGVSIADALPEIVASLGEDVSSGAVVTNVYVGSPAFRAGIRPGDIIVTVGRRRIENADNLIQSVSDLMVNQETDFRILRDRESTIVSVLIDERADDEAIRDKSARFWPGLRLYPVTDYLKEEMEGLPPRGIVVLGVDAGSPADSAGFSSGDVITVFGETATDSLADFYTRLREAEGKKLVATVLREGETIELSLGPVSTE
jgi:serine protease Do